MVSAMHLPSRRYTVLDGIAIAFRCDPLAAFFYGFFELAWAVLVPFGTLAAARLIDSVESVFRDGGSIQPVFTRLLILVGIIAFGWLRSSMHNLADLRLVLALRSRYRTALTEKRTRLQYRLLENDETWDLIQRVAANPEGGRLKQTYFHIVELAAFIIKVGGLLIILATAVWWLPLAVAAVSGMVLIIGLRGGKALYRAEREVTNQDRRLDYLGEVMIGRDAAAERTLFGAEGMLGGMYRQAFDAALKVRIRARLKWYLNAYTGNVTNLLIWMLLMLLLLVPLKEGLITIGLFIALTQAFTKFDIVWGFMDTVNGLAADSEFFKGLTRFLALAEEPGADLTRVPWQVGAIPAVSRDSNFLVEMRDVSFTYPGTSRPILDGLSLKLEAGRHYALVGANGCGKTTLTRLITGLYPVDSGSIYIQGREINSFKQPELLGLFSIVYQDFSRYNISLRDNIFLGGDNLAQSEDAEMQIYEQAGLLPLIDRLPAGAATPLGRLIPGGVDISGGEWQRVAMARCLARPANLRILDEPAAAMDPLAESELYASFEKLARGVTTLLITHRLGATKTSDVILVMDAGRIVESGSHNSLMQLGGLYSKMYRSQRYWYEQD